MTDEETLKRDKLLLDIMIHAYDEDERRNALVDTKNSQMILLTGSMLTLQATLISKMLIDTIFSNPIINVNLWCKIVLSVLLIISLVFYFISMYQFITAYTFKDNYKIAPEHESVIETLNYDCSEADIVEDMIYVYDKSMSKNDVIIDKKIDTASKGFIFLEIAGILTLVFLFLFVIVLCFEYFNGKHSL